MRIPKICKRGRSAVSSIPRKVSIKSTLARARKPSNAGVFTTAVLLGFTVIAFFERRYLLCPRFSDVIGSFRRRPEGLSKPHGEVHLVQTDSSEWYEPL